MLMSQEQRDARKKQWEEEDAVPHQPSYWADNWRTVKRWAQCDVNQIINLGLDLQGGIHMVLGFDQYAGSLQKIRNYVMTGIEVSRLPYRLSSPVKSGILDFHVTRPVYSWVDHFLRDHVHIVGLGMDFTEIDLWWLLVHKRRRDHRSGLVFYYYIGRRGCACVGENLREGLFESSGSH